MVSYSIVIVKHMRTLWPAAEYNKLTITTGNWTIYPRLTSTKNHLFACLIVIGNENNIPKQKDFSFEITNQVLISV